MRSPDIVRFVVHADRLSIRAIKRPPQNNKHGVLICVISSNVGVETRRSIGVGLFAIHRQARCLPGSSDLIWVVLLHDAVTRLTKVARSRSLGRSACSSGAVTVSAK